MQLSKLKRRINTLKYALLNYSQIQIKVLLLTNNDPWFSPIASYREIESYSYDSVSAYEICSVIYSRLSSKRWRCCYKALLLLDYLLKNGGRRLYYSIKENVYIISSLCSYSHWKNGRDLGHHVRVKADDVLKLLERMKEECSAGGRSLEDPNVTSVNGRRRECAERAGANRQRAGYVEELGPQRSSYVHDSYGEAVRMAGREAEKYESSFGNEYYRRYNSYDNSEEIQEVVEFPSRLPSYEDFTAEEPAEEKTEDALFNPNEMPKLSNNGKEKSSVHNKYNIWMDISEE